MIVTISERLKVKNPEVDCNFKIQVTPSPFTGGKVRVQGSQLLLAGFKRHPYGASLGKEEEFWLNKTDIVFH